MRTNTVFSVPEFFDRYSQLLFWTTGLFSVVFFSLGIYFNSTLFFGLPFLGLFLLLALLNFRTVFFLMLLVLPVSVESYLAGLGIDLPSEPMVILLAGCTFLYLIFYNVEVNKKLLFHPIFIVIVLQLAWSIFATLFSTDIILSVKYILAKSWYLLGFLVLPMVLIRNEKMLRTFFWCLFIPTLLSVVYVMLRHATMHFTFDNITKSVHPLYRNHVNYAVFITMLLPFIFLARTWYPKHYLRSKVLKYSILVFLAAIYFSYTRGAWLALLAMPVYIIAMRFKLTKYVISIACIAVIAFTIYILSNNNYLKYAPDYEHTIYHEDLSEHLSSTFEMQDMSTVERFYRWIAAEKMFMDNPVVGVGPNNFVTNYKKYTVSAYETYISDNEEKSTVHNYFLLLLTEQGLPALLLFVLLIVLTLLTAERTYAEADPAHKKYIVAITLCIVTFLINNSLSDLVEANKVGSLFFMSLGLLIAFSRKTISVGDK